MATRNTPQGPCDREAERATLAAGLWFSTWHWQIQHVVAPGDYRYPEHQAISAALDELHDVGPFWPLEVPDFADPDLRWPSSLATRCSAVATITDLNPVTIRALAGHADGCHLVQAARIAEHAATRREIYALRLQLADLT